mgnify:CR=1 FL=1
MRNLYKNKQVLQYCIFLWLLSYYYKVGLPYNDLPDELMNVDKLEVSSWSVIIKDTALWKIAKKSKERVVAGNLAVQLSATTSLLTSLTPSNSLPSTQSKGEVVRSHGVTVLNIHGAFAVTDAGIRPLADSLSALVSLDIGGCNKVTDASLRALAMTTKNLTNLNIDGCKFIVNEGLVALASCCKGMKRLSMAHCPRVREWLIIRLAEGLNQLEEFNISGMLNI